MGLKEVLRDTYDAIVRYEVTRRENALNLHNLRERQFNPDGSPRSAAEVAQEAKNFLKSGMSSAYNRISRSLESNI